MLRPYPVTFGPSTHRCRFEGFTYPSLWLGCKLLALHGQEPPGDKGRSRFLTLLGMTRWPGWVLNQVQDDMCGGGSWDG